MCSQCIFYCYRAIEAFNNFDALKFSRDNSTLDPDMGNKKNTYMGAIVVHLLYYILLCINVCWNRLRMRLKLYPYVLNYEKSCIRHTKIFYYFEIENIINDFHKLL